MGFFLLMANLTYGQDPHELDSLEQRIGLVTTDSAKLDAMNDFCRAIVDIDPEKSIHTAQQSLKMAEEKKFSLYQAISLNNIGNGYYNLADYKTSLKYYLKALKIQESIHNKKGILSSSGAIGNVFLGLDKPDEALGYFNRALQIAQELGNKNGIASCLISIGTIYSDKKDFKRSLDYNFQSLKLFLEVDNEDAVATAYNNIADSYLELKDYSKSLLYINKAAELYTKNGNVYGQSLAFNNIADFYHAVGNEEKALEYYQRGLEKGKQINANERIIASYQGIYKVHKKLGRFKEALYYHELFQQLNDSIYNVESNKQIEEMQARFDSEKKEQEIALLTKDSQIRKEELRTQTLINRAVLSVGVLLLLLVIMAIRGNMQKKRTNRELALKNEKIELAYNIIEDQHKDIKDSINYARRIQLAILPPEQNIKQLLPDSFVLYMPKDIVSGDFYWVEPWGNKVLFAAVDCTGHGVPGALMSVVGYNLLNKALNELGIDKPALILNSLSKGIEKTLRQTGNEAEVKDGMDLALCAFDPGNMMLEYAGAFNPLYLVRDQQLIEFPPDKISIGSGLDEGQKNYTNREIPVQKGDIVYIFTDGYADQFGGEKGKKFKYRALQQLLLSNSHESMDRQRMLLERHLHEWKGKLEQVDDILIMGIRI